MEIAEGDELQRIQLFRSRLQNALAQDQATEEIDDATLRRFLRARSLNVDKALKFLLQHLKWKHTFMPDGYVHASEIRNELKKEKIFLQGVDKKGRPVGVILAVRHEVFHRDLEEFKRFVVFGFDRAVASLSGGQEKFVLIADLKGWTYRNMDMKGYLAVLEILQDHYPERLGKLFMIHVPYLFWGAWKIVYPFIDPVVKEKICFVEDKHLKETLLKDIDASQLPEIYGGQLSLKPVQTIDQT